MAVVIVTGAGGGLGAAVVEALVARGDRVAAVVSPRSLDKVQGKRGAFPIALDDAKNHGWSDVLARVDAELGAPEGAVLTAGSWAGGKPLVEAADTELSAMLEANLATAYAALRALLPGMIARGHGSVVVVGSRAAERPWTSARAAAYAASKAALVALAQAVAAETLMAGVRVNAVLPSTIDTRANRAAMPDADASRWVTPESLAAVIAFLLSDGARDVSGAAIPVYGRA